MWVLSISFYLTMLLVKEDYLNQLLTGSFDVVNVMVPVYNDVTTLVVIYWTPASDFFHR